MTTKAASRVAEGAARRAQYPAGVFLAGIRRSKAGPLDWLQLGTNADLERALGSALSNGQLVPFPATCLDAVARPS